MNKQRKKFTDLTTTELSVLGLMATGVTSQEASAMLNCSQRTIQWHLASINRRKGTTNLIQACIKVGFLTLSTPVKENNE